MKPKIGPLALLAFLVVLWSFTLLFIGGFWTTLPLTFLLAGSIWLIGKALMAGSRISNLGVSLAMGLIVVILLFLTPPQFYEHEPQPRPFFLEYDLVAFLLSQLLPALGVIAAALLLSAGIRHGLSNPESSQAADNGNSRLAALAEGLLSALALAGGLYQFYWLLVWDSTYDALGVLNLIPAVLAALFAAAILAELLAVRRQWLGLLYAVLVPGLMLAVYLNAMLVDTQMLTQSRAERIGRALENYHVRQGSYPESLDELRPWTMLAIPVPVIMHGQDWCYQGEQDAYRLGYVDRADWSSPELFATLAELAGEQTGESELCQEAIATLKAVYPKFYGLGD